MADEEKEQEPRKGGKKEKEEEAEGAEKPKRRFSLKLLAIVGLGIILVGGGVFFVWRHFGAASEKKEAPAAEAAAPVGQTYRLEQFIVNLVDPLGRRYLKLQVELEMDTPTAVQEAGKRDAQLRDTIITLLTSKSYGDIDSPEGKLELRQEIIARCNQFLHSGKAINAYFTDFVVQ